MCVMRWLGEWSAGLCFNDLALVVYRLQRAGYAQQHEELGHIDNVGEAEDDEAEDGDEQCDYEGDERSKRPEALKLPVIRSDA